MNPDTGQVYSPKQLKAMAEDFSVFAEEEREVRLVATEEERARFVDKHAMMLEAEQGLRPSRARRRAESLVPPVGASRLVLVSEEVAKTIRRGQKATEAQRRKAKRAQAKASRRRNR